MACHETYLHIQQNKAFSGILPEYKIPLLAKAIGKSVLSVKRKLNQLQELGLIKHKKTCWMLVCSDFVTATQGRTRKHRVNVTDFVGNASRMTTFAYASFISGQVRNSQRKQRKVSNNPSTVIPLAASITAVKLNKSDQTIHKQRSRAKKAGMLSYKRDITFLKFGHFSKTDVSEYVSDNSGKTFVSKKGHLIHESPALFENGVKSKRRSIAKSLYLVAKDCHWVLSRGW